MLKRYSGFLSAATLMVLLAACANLGLAPAQSFDQKLAYSYGVHISVLQSAAAGVTNGQLSTADGEAILKLSDDSKVLLDAARIASGAGDLATAENRLTLATSILTQLQTYLREHSK